MKMLGKRSVVMTALLACALIIASVTIAAAAPTVTLTVLNAPNEFGEIIVVRGDTVEVEFSIVDPGNETSPQDLIILRRVGDNSVANKQQRGKELTGSRSIGTQKVNGSDILGELRVEYYSMATSSLIATAAKTIFLVDNQSMVDLTNRTGAVEQEAAAAKEMAAAADTKATEAKSKADILMEKVEALRARADATDNELLAAKLEREAAKLERQANALAAQEAKAAAAAADTKASNAKTSADAADAKATAADAKAADAQSKADMLMAKAEELRARADATDNELLAAKLEREAAKLERQANALAAQEAKAAAVAADTKASNAKTSADAADAKATAADAKATDAQTKADTALTENVNLQTQINSLPSAAQTCPADEYVTGFDSGGNVICAACSAAPGASPLVLLAYYPLDGDVLDATANNYDGTVGGTETYDIGHTGQAFSFNGATYVATMLDINASVHPQLTMGAWVRPTAGTWYGQVMTHDDQGFDRSIIHYGSDWRAYDGGSGGSVHTGPIVASDDWQFVAVVYDQDRQTVMLYVDGSTLTKAEQVLGPSVNMFRLGNNQSNGVEFFRGLIDEVFVVSGALTVTELDQIRLNGVRNLFP